MANEKIIPEEHHFRPDGTVINSRLPLLVYRNAVRAEQDGDLEKVVKATFLLNDWSNNWTYRGVYPYPHFHSTSHEVLGIVRGKAALRLGGAAQPPMVFEAGDVILVPAGVSHTSFADNEHRALGGTDDVLTVGGYFDGRDWDLMRDGEISDAEMRAAVKRILSLPIPSKDPVHGQPIEAWRNAPTSLEWGLAYGKATGIEDLHK